ncbi:FAD/NAD(P)-binding protein [Galactobacter caseinivorans]|nr:FAD/NAD(P)-binding protein [Galactobacter caseinivorans]
MVNPTPTQQPLGGREDAWSVTAPQASSPSGRHPHTIALIGAGPRALMLIERLTAHHAGAAHGRPSRRAPLELHLIDPHPAGAGRIWRSEQSPLLRLNSTAADVTVFPDASCELGAPAFTGPSLAQWAKDVRNGWITLAVAPDATTAREVDRLQPTDFPSRRLHSLYLSWAFERVLKRAADFGIAIRTHQDTVERVVTAGDRGPEVVHLASGGVLTADAVVYLVGHTDAAPSEESAQLAQASRELGLLYFPPAYTADVDHSALAPGQDVLVRGLGLASIDLMVLLTEGRGGRFEALPGQENLPEEHQGLRYVPSGREPRLLFGSRRGVPYRSKSMQTLGHAPAPLEVFTRERVLAAADAVASGTVASGTGADGSDSGSNSVDPWDFERDAWPLIATELHLTHYRELFAHHAERTRGGWEATRDVIVGTPWDSAALRGHLLAAVPLDVDRFHVAHWDRPLTGLATATRAEVDSLLSAHLRTDLRQHVDQAHTPTLAVWHALLQIHVLLAESPRALWTQRSLEHSIPVVWQSFFSYLASGPPPVRLRQLLALVEAGTVGFVGPDLSVELTRDAKGRPAFRAHSPAVAEPVTASALVDAWLPATNPLTTTNPALADLAQAAGVVGRRIVVEARTGRVLRPEGTPLDARWALGAATSTPDAGAFSRPGVNALPFRSTDRAAGAIFSWLTAASRPTPHLVPSLSTEIS